MNHEAIYRRARLEPEFRTQQLTELRQQQRLAGGSAILILAAWAAYAGYCALSEHRWTSVDPIAPLLICLVIYSHAAHQRAALQAMAADLPAAASR